MKESCISHRTLLLFGIGGLYGISLERLHTDYLDLYLIHWPKQSEMDADWKQKIIDTWRAMEELYAKGKSKALGLSNFLPHHLDVVLEHCNIMPVVDQLELHPGYLQEAAVSYAISRGIVLQACSQIRKKYRTDLSEIFVAKKDASFGKDCMVRRTP